MKKTELFSGFCGHSAEETDRQSSIMDSAEITAVDDTEHCDTDSG
jgi:hypothetical protein